MVLSRIHSELNNGWIQERCIQHRDSLIDRRMHEAEEDVEVAGFSTAGSGWREIGALRRLSGRVICAVDHARPRSAAGDRDSAHKFWQALAQLFCPQSKKGPAVAAPVGCIDRQLI